MLRIDSLDAEGRGVGRNAEGKVTFVEGALPGEEVSFQVLKKKSSFEVARVTAITHAASSRQLPRCPHFGVCGGCSLQHADARTQMAAKQRWLEENLARIGKVEPETLLPIVYGPDWHYRARARLGARYVFKKGGAMVGFREKRSSYITDMRECHVLPRHISELITPLRGLVEMLSIQARLPQIELACGDADSILVIRHLDALEPRDELLLREFSQRHGVSIWLQPGGPDSAHPFHPAPSELPQLLHYALPEFGLRLHFRPTDFTQVNHGVNRILVSRAVRLLDPRPGERVADLFCGIGNFSLPLATRGAEVIGFEGSRELVERARHNALLNKLTVQFELADLFENDFGALGPFDKLLIDPPREGAVELVKGLPDAWPRRIVYVSCDPATLARDAGVLIHTRGFRLTAAGVVNMFPHTAHVESIALFER
ncbi:MAG TPA: 23S rRNA (uracil(1939)-C(5))-methyltransferase RlmD [Burkholderiales bacterium]|nr:23S rRNA (uracil(1939)-C(5))-methyltransferase RlmD [Burkholderiales bacterium]